MYRCCPIISSYIIVFLLLFDLGYAIDRQSLDSSIDSTSQKKETFPKKIISAWQYFSYRTSLFDCPFYPSCSNSVCNHFRGGNFYLGTIYSINRLVRCNPLAGFCYRRNQNGYLIDNSEMTQIQWSKGPFRYYLSKGVVSLFSLIPGFSKSIHGKWSDGLATASLVALSASRSLWHYNHKEYLRLSVTGSALLSIYIADFTWSLRKIFRQRRVN